MKLSFPALPVALTVAIAAPALALADDPIVVTPDQPYRENFDGGPGGWVTGPSNPSGAFEHGVPAQTHLSEAWSGKKVWMTDLDADVVDAQTSAVSPAFDFSQFTEDPVFHLAYNVHGWAYGELDWYVNDKFVDFAEICGEEVPLQWNGTGGWVTASYPLKGMAGKTNVTIKLFAESDNCEGFAFDSVVIGADPKTWGSFDSTRLGADDMLHGGSPLAKLRSRITASGAVVATPTATLTAAYLEDVDVFYTAKLPGGFSLSIGERFALKSWILGGGTLVVAGEKASSEDFLGPFDGTIESYGGSTIFAPTSNHPLVEGVTELIYAVGTKLTGSAEWTTVAIEGSATVVAVREGLGHAGLGRVLFVGDGDMLASEIDHVDNGVFATNVVDWAAEGPDALVCGEKPLAVEYGDGWTGTNGVPTIEVTWNPAFAAPFGLFITNTAGAKSFGYLAVGATKQSTATGLGGTLLNEASILLPITVKQAGLQLDAIVPWEVDQCGLGLHVQAILSDAGASHGYSFTRGTEIIVGFGGN